MELYLVKIHLLRQKRHETNLKKVIKLHQQSYWRMQD
jgi:hypothetical protein